MTLHQYLIDNGIKLNEKSVSRIGQRIGDKYRDTYKKSPIKTRVKGLTGKINQYPPSFLRSCTDLIIELLNPIPIDNG